MRGLFEFFSIFNWITPVVGFIEDFLNDPTLLQSNSWTFFVPYSRSLDNGWNAFDIEDLMGRHGIKTWGGQITGGEFFFSVKLEQAQWAEYILLNHGVPVNEKYLGAPRPKQKTNRPRQKRRKSGKDPLSFIDDFFDGIF
jgi:hypothetical protein